LGNETCRPHHVAYSESIPLATTCVTHRDPKNEFHSIFINSIQFSFLDESGAFSVEGRIGFERKQRKQTGYQIRKETKKVLERK